jgi:hypothetical protein
MKITAAPRAAVSVHQADLTDKLIEALERSIKETEITAPEALGAVLALLTWFIAAASADLHGDIADALAKAIPQIMLTATDMQQAAVTPN